MAARHVWPRFSRVLARNELYLANHSLGRPPDRAADDLRAAIDAWYSEMDSAWKLWMQGRERSGLWFTAKLVNAPRADCIVPKISAGQGLRAVLNALPGKPRVLTTDAEFDSIDFILRVYRDKGRIELKVRAVRFVPLRALRPRRAFHGRFPHRQRFFQASKKRSRSAHARRALVLLDVYHHAGVLPLDLGALDADFAVGGSYKYLRGGPGACWLYVHPRHHGLRTLDTGWFAKEDVFAYERPEPPRFAAGGDAWLESTPAVLAPFQALAGLEVTLELGVGRIREYNLSQKRFLKSVLPVQGEGEDYGAFVTVEHKNAKQLAAVLEERGIKTDARGEYLRICPDMLNRRGELEHTARVLKDILAL